MMLGSRTGRVSPVRGYVASRSEAAAYETRSTEDTTAQDDRHSEEAKSRHAPAIRLKRYIKGKATFREVLTIRYGNSWRSACQFNGLRGSSGQSSHAFATGGDRICVQGIGLPRGSGVPGAKGNLHCETRILSSNDGHAPIRCGRKRLEVQARLWQPSGRRMNGCS